MRPLVISENFRALFYAPFYAAHATGAYETAGVQVVLRTSESPAATAAALRAGEADLMWGGPLRVIYAHAEDTNADLVCFCDVVSRDPFFLIGRQPRPDFVLPELASLRFATVSEVPTPWICLAQDIALAGLNPATLPRVANQSMAENAAALARGELDVIQVFQPYAETLIRAGTGHVWHEAANRGPTAYTMLVTRRPTLAARREEFQRLTNAMAATLNWFHATDPAEIARALHDFFPDVALDIFAAAIARYRALGLWSTNPMPNRAGFTWLHAAMRAHGGLARDVDYETCVDESLAASAPHLSMRVRPA